MGTVDDLLRQGPLTAGQGTRHPLGVPDDYTVHNVAAEQVGTAIPVLGQIYKGMTQTAPRYYTGDELVPFREDDQGNRTYVSAPEDVASLQNQMVAVGLIRPGQKFIHGQFDDVTQTAYKEILELANKQGMSWQAAMTSFQPGQLVTADKKGRVVGVGAVGAGGRAPFSPVLTPKEDLSSIYKQVAQKHLGRDPTPSEIDAFTKTYSSTELNAQQQAYNAQAAGGATKGPPNPGAAAEAQLTQTGTGLGAESGAHDIANTFDNFLGLIRGPSASQA